MRWFTRLFEGLRGKSGRSRSGTRPTSRKLRLGELEPRLLLSGTRFDMGTSNSPVSSGYVGVPVVGYTSARGFGWTNSAAVAAQDRAASSALNRDFHTGKDGTFQVNLPNGLHRVTVKLGDAMSARDNIDVYLNGKKAASNITTQAGQFWKKSEYVAVTNGKLSLRLVDNGGNAKTAGWALDGLEIAPYTGPTASAGGNQNAHEGAEVAFKGAAGGMGPLSYAWDFGDGSKASGMLTPKHTYTDNGKYVATLTVTDSQGLKTKSSTTVAVANVDPRPNALGPYAGEVDTPVVFTGIARDPSLKDLAAGLKYSWNFGDGKTGSGPAPEHTYSAAKTYAVTLTVTDKDGGSRSMTTTAVIGREGSLSDSRGEYQLLANNNLLANTEYNCLKWDEMAASGAWGVNAKWEQGKSEKWYIEQQRYGENLIIGGALHGNTAAIEAGLKAFDWGFARQAADGSFAGTGDAFHSTSMFVEAVAHATLVLKQSPYAAKYQSKLNDYVKELHKAANWMATPAVWEKGLSYDAPYTHRRYIVANALAMSAKLDGGDDRLMNMARSQIREGLSLQLSNGVNPEKGGYDSSYQAYGLSLAQRWVTYFPSDSVTTGVRSMIDKGLAWEKTMILDTGEVSMDGNARSGIETGPSGAVKTVDWKKAVDAFAYWYARTGDKDLLLDAQEIAQFYYKGY